MDTRPLRVMLIVTMTVFLLVCVAFLLQHLGVYADGVDAWFEDNQWLMWTSVGLMLASASAIPLLSLGQDR
ncbi:hypothetical protein [Amycolatopsis sp. CA-230715]|uniref:hypothetical protein n=1 Tax=Amycolatopsis sp. CA-230715 TaxID=2745196 RepID=UPI001C03604B|nr:hypothetical protein [Amycolatopsis sp. CA-230715]QWF78926.1 hypothetical protein HUW46_02325 [Amycolatopsis sp. CA-230715]